MSEKPTYLGLLNAISVAESDAGEYLAAWVAVTPSADVRAVINTVALRESEHGLAFAKRIDELGYSVIPKLDPKHAERMVIAASTTLSDKEKFEALGLGQSLQNGARDIFDTFFENKDLDPVTGALLGRYVAEERDSGRKLVECYSALCADAEPTTPSNRAKTKTRTKRSPRDARAGVESSRVVHRRHVRGGTLRRPSFARCPRSPTSSPTSRPAAIEVIDLTAPLSSRRRSSSCRAEFGQTQRFELEEISRYDDRGPAWYWNNIRTGEHTGTHFDAPNHWVTGKDGDDVASGAGPAADRPGGRARLLRRRPPPTRTSCSRSSTSRSGRPTHGPLPDGGWLLYRTGWDARSATPAGVPQRQRDRSAHAGDLAGVRPVACRGDAGAGRRASRRSAPTPARRTRSTRRSRATRS